jgi:hypothetical protein
VPHTSLSSKILVIWLLLNGVAKDSRTRQIEKTKERKENPWRKIEKKMAAMIVRRLMTDKISHPFRFVAKNFEEILKEI